MENQSDSEQRRSCWCEWCRVEEECHSRRSKRGSSARDESNEASKGPERGRELAYGSISPALDVSGTKQPGMWGTMRDSPEGSGSTYSASGKDGVGPVTVVVGSTCSLWWCFTLCSTWSFLGARAAGWTHDFSPDLAPSKSRPYAHARASYPHSGCGAWEEAGGVVTGATLTDPLAPDLTAHVSA